MSKTFEVTLTIAAYVDVDAEGVAHFVRSQLEEDPECFLVCGMTVQEADESESEESE